MKNKFRFLFSAAFLIAQHCFLNAQGPSLSWAKSMGGPAANFDGASAAATDAAGNVYTFGMFDGTVDYDPGPGISTLTSNGLTDIFIQKLDASGNLVWARSAGGPDYEFSGSITVDAAGNVYATGVFYDTADFDPGPLVFDLQGSYDAFILKLDASGNFVWAKSVGGPGYSIGQGITTDASGNVIVSGQFSDTTDFDPGAATSNLISSGSADGFVLKLNSSGNFVWAKSMGGPNDDGPQSVCADASGNVYAAGHFSGTVDFDPGAGIQNSISNGANEDAFVLKLDLAGNFVWVRTFGGTGEDYILSLALDAIGNIYSAGYFDGTTDFDPGAGNVAAASNGFRDFFVHKLDASGNFIWATATGGGNYDEALSICVDASGNVYTTGEFTGPADFDPGPSVYYLNQTGYAALFIQKLDANGNLLWADLLNSNYHSIGRTITVDPNFNIYVVADYKDTVDAAPGPGIYNIISNGEYDICVVKLNQCNTWTVANQSACNNFTWMGIPHTTSGVYSDTLVNAAGCDSIQYLVLTINSVDTSVVQSGATLTANANPATYQWVDCNNSYALVSGETSQTFTPASNGNYAVIITQNNCQNISSCYNITSTATESNVVIKYLSASPNPNNGNFTIKTNVAGSFSITNSQGRIVRTFKTEAGAEVYVNDLDNGVYFITMNNKEIISKKIVVIKN